MKKTMTPPNQIINFLLNAEIDDSCRAIIARTQELPLSDWLRRHHPINVEGLRRCRLLLEQCPHVAEEFPAMADVSPQWATIVAAWPIICESMDKECPNWRQTLWNEGAWQGQEARHNLNLALNYLNLALNLATDNKQ